MEVYQNVHRHFQNFFQLFQNFLSTFSKCISKFFKILFCKFFIGSNQNFCIIPCIRQVIGGKKCRENLPDFFQNNGSILAEAIDIAEGFNGFFSGIGPELANKFVKMPNSPKFPSWTIMFNYLLERGTKRFENV